MTRNERYRRTWKGMYTLHKINAKRRGIEFELTPNQWKAIWFMSGHWRQRGPRMGQYVMCRVGDAGPYAWGNVFIGPAKVNLNYGGMWTRFRQSPEFPDDAEHAPSCERDQSPAENPARWT
jgi:hypothetical protein